MSDDHDIPAGTCISIVFVCTIIGFILLTVLGAVGC